MTFRAVLLFIAALAASPAPLPAAEPSRVDFNRDIRPILSDNCYFCHGPDKAKRKADLRLDTKEGLFSKIDDVFPVVPGKPGDSDLFRRISSAVPDEKMPPPKSNKKLSPAQIDLLRRWIEQGAPYKGHWAYASPARAPLPEIRNTQHAIRNPIDAFLTAHAQSQGLSLSPEADRTTLIRRLYQDLVGLPPTPAEVEAFVHDPSPNAYDNLVDRLLASPHFGERMAIFWLDLVRYADSIGYHSDNPRDVAPYRDWVIDAFNSNKPFDQFTVEQLAGDLLPNPTLQQKVASAYNRLIQTTEEGGAQPKEYTAKYAADRVRNVSTVWLASTMGCCECHDHKFDPFTTKDFYSMEAFFADVKEAAVGRREDGMPVPTEKQAEALKKLDESIADAKSKLNASTPQLAEAQSQWEQSIRELRLPDWTLLKPESVKSQNGTDLKIDPDLAVHASGPNTPDADVYTVSLKTNLKNITAFRLEALTRPGLPRNGPGRAGNGNFVLTEIEVTARDGETSLPVTLANASATFEQKQFGEGTPYGLYSAASAIDKDVKGTAAGWAILEQVGKDHHIVFESAEPLNPDGHEIILTFTLKQQHGTKHTLGRFRIAATTSPKPVAAATGQEPPREILTIAKLDPNQRSDARKQQLAAHFRSITPLLDTQRAAVTKLETDKANYLKGVRKTLITIADAPRTVKVLARGNWMDDSGEVMQPAIPAFLGQLPVQGRRANRLDLANWLVARDNPLTARVFVNRLWKLFYGAGLSKSLEDFGAQSEWPTNLDLLDHLAVEFIDSHWDVKHMVKLLVTSSAYRQTSNISPLLKEKDPENRLFARQNRFRLDAELVRDNALAISGLLVSRIGGESVKPYQPAGYWDYLNFPKRTWEHDHGEAQYRRGLYTWWQRTFLHPSLLAFDAPTREECTAERPRSNIPQQALALLNDPSYVEAARAFATRIMKEGGSTTPDRILFALNTALSRHARPQEVQILSDLFAKHLEQYTQDKIAAQKLLTIGESPVPKDTDLSELAAWTSVARTILNLHETITRY